MLWKNKVIWQWIAISQLAIIYTVGIVGLNSRFEQMFASLTPYNLLVSLLLILPFVSNYKKVFLYFLLAFTIGMVVEIIGVKTGFPFGTYNYTPLLVLSIFSVPLLIGVNWFLLSYGIISLVNQASFLTNWFLKSLVGALLMTSMDFLIEPFAIHYQLWIWQSETIPYENYLAWFVVSFVLFLIGLKLLPKEQNKVAAALLIIMFFFFFIKTISFLDLF